MNIVAVVVSEFCLFSGSVGEHFVAGAASVALLQAPELLQHSFSISSISPSDMIILRSHRAGMMDV